MKENNITHTVLKDIGFTLLEEGKTIKVKAEGFSMYPNVKPGSVIYIEPVENKDTLLPGEIIAWKRDPGFVIHRLIRIIETGNRKYFVTRGDSSLMEDEPVAEEIIGGRIIKVEYPDNKPVKENIYKRTEIHYSRNRGRVRILLYLKKIKRIFGFK